MTNVREALETIERWPLDQQVELAHTLRERLVAQGWVPESPPAHLAEIERRLADAMAHPQDVIEWDEIVAHVRRKP